jgi:CRP-like cAMP-binding protein
MTLPRGQIVFQAGDTPDALYYVSGGKIKLTHARETDSPLVRDVVVSILGPGEFFGGPPLFDTSVHSYTAAALTRVQLKRMPHGAVDELMHKNEPFARMLLRYLSRRVKSCEETISTLITHTVAGRVARTVLLLASRFGEQHSDGIFVQHDVTQSDIAMMVGASREAVNKALTDFASREWMSLGTRNFTIYDEDRLRAFIHSPDTLAAKSAVLATV